jgi:L-histidine N-alpha-methyltransferase
MLREVMEGLGRAQKEISPKYFYDARGSELFDEITELPEYYLTRVERGLLERWVPEWAREQGPRSLVELGSGSARKTRILLDALEPGALFVPVDVSEAFLHDTADRLRSEYPRLLIEPRVADIALGFGLPDGLPHPALFAFLGSTIGNFTRPAAVRLLSRVRSHMTAADHFLLGVDLRPGGEKSVADVEAAYNDARGVTAEFNLNALQVLNRELGADFDPAAFRHLAFYDAEEGRIEMHLTSVESQIVHVPGGGGVFFREGETLRTEISCKYDRAAVEGLLAPAGLRVSGWQEDPRGFYALVLGSPS